jgi:hypothetical protein
LTSSNAKKIGFFYLFFAFFAQIPSEIDSLLYLFRIQPLESARGRSRKRPRANTRSSSISFLQFSTENDSDSFNHRRKRVRKTRQLPQFDVHQDEILGINSAYFDATEKYTPALIGLQTGKIWPHISVEIPFRPEIHQYSSESISEKANREPLASLSSIALNGARKAPKFPQNWLKKQPNDHTSIFKTLF